MTMETQQVIPQSTRVVAEHQQPYQFATTQSGQTLPVLRWNIPRGSQRVSVIWCPHCDYSQQKTKGDSCENCRALYSMEAPGPQVDPYADADENANVGWEVDWKATAREGELRYRRIEGYDSTLVESEGNSDDETPLTLVPGENAAEVVTDQDNYCYPCGRQFESLTASHLRSAAHILNEEAQGLTSPSPSSLINPSED